MKECVSKEHYFVQENATIAIVRDVTKSIRSCRSFNHQLQNKLNMSVTRNPDYFKYRRRLWDGCGTWQLCWCAGQDPVQFRRVFKVHQKFHVTEKKNPKRIKPQNYTRTSLDKTELGKQNNFIDVLPEHQQRPLSCYDCVSEQLLLSDGFVFE